MVVRSRAPLRLGFGGGGSELPPYIEKYGGLVLNATINKFAYASIEETSDHTELLSLDQGCSATIGSLIEPKTHLPKHLRLHYGVLKRVANEFNGGSINHIKLSTYCDVPIGSGLGTSSTITVAIVKAFDEYLRLSLSEYQIADLAHKIEREDLGLSGGLQDQYASTFGGINYIEFKKNGAVVVNPLRLSEKTVAELEYSTILWFTGAARDSGSVIQKNLQLLYENNSSYIEKTHQIKGVVPDLKESILKGQLDKFASLINSGWMAKRKMHSSVSNDRVDQIYEKIITMGAMAAKITGAGNGGYMMIICRPECRNELINFLAKINDSFLNFTFTETGAFSWRV